MLRDYHRKYLSKKGSGGREVHRTATEKTTDFSRGRHLSPRKTTSDDERKNIILMTRHYPGLGSAYDWLKRNSLAFQPIRSTTYIWVVTGHQHGIFAFVTQTSFCEGSSGDLAKRRLFTQAIPNYDLSSI